MGPLSAAYQRTGGAARRSCREQLGRAEDDMRGRVKTLLACGALLAAGLGAASPAAASVARSTGVAGATIDGCTATVSNITQETLNGKAVVTFTGQVECSSPATHIYLQTALYNCGSLQPRESHDFLAANCDVNTNAETFTPEESGVTYTITGEKAAGDGYVAPVLVFVLNGTVGDPLLGGTASGPIYGTPVLCSSSSCTNVTYGR
jgi:hypothetical protein